MTGQRQCVLGLCYAFGWTGSGSLETSTFLGSKGSNQAVHRAKCWQVAPCVRPVAMISGSGTLMPFVGTAFQQGWCDDTGTHYKLAGTTGNA